MAGTIDWDEALGRLHWPTQDELFDEWYKSCPVSSPDVVSRLFTKWRADTLRDFQTWRHGTAAGSYDYAPLFNFSVYMTKVLKARKRVTRKDLNK